MRIANILAETEVEGPGRRAAVWLQGCSLRCVGCCNPGYQDPNGGRRVDPRESARQLIAPHLEGITILGGEPLDQPEGLLVFLQALRSESSLGIMLFTGHPWEAISGLPNGPAIIALCDLVKAGPFLPDHTPETRAWIGSTNQTLHFLTDRYRHLENAWPLHRPQIEFHLRAGELLINGTPWHDSTLSIGGDHE